MSTPDVIIEIETPLAENPAAIMNPPTKCTVAGSSRSSRRSSCDSATGSDVDSTSADGHLNVNIPGASVAIESSIPQEVQLPVPQLASGDVTPTVVSPPTTKAPTPPSTSCSFSAPPAAPVIGAGPLAAPDFCAPPHASSPHGRTIPLPASTYTIVSKQAVDASQMSSLSSQMGRASHSRSRVTKATPRPPLGSPPWMEPQTPAPVPVSTSASVSKQAVDASQMSQLSSQTVRPSHSRSTVTMATPRPPLGLPPCMDPFAPEFCAAPHVRPLRRPLGLPPPRAPQTPAPVVESSRSKALPHAKHVEDALSRSHGNVEVKSAFGSPSLFAGPRRRMWPPSRTAAVRAAEPKTRGLFTSSDAHSEDSSSSSSSISSSTSSIGSISSMRRIIQRGCDSLLSTTSELRSLSGGGRLFVNTPAASTAIVSSISQEAQLTFSQVASDGTGTGSHIAACPPAAPIIGDGPSTAARQVLSSYGCPMPVPSTSTTRSIVAAQAAAPLPTSSSFGEPSPMATPPFSSDRAPVAGDLRPLEFPPPMELQPYTSAVGSWKSGARDMDQMPTEKQMISNLESQLQTDVTSQDREWSVPIREEITEMKALHASQGIYDEAVAYHERLPPPPPPLPDVPSSGADDGHLKRTHVKFEDDISISSSNVMWRSGSAGDTNFSTTKELYSISKSFGIDMPYIVQNAKNTAPVTRIRNKPHTVQVVSENPTCAPPSTEGDNGGSLARAFDDKPRIMLPSKERLNKGLEQLQSVASTLAGFSFIAQSLEPAERSQRDQDMGDLVGSALEFDAAGFFYFAFVIIGSSIALWFFSSSNRAGGVTEPYKYIHFLVHILLSLLLFTGVVLLSLSMTSRLILLENGASRALTLMGGVPVSLAIVAILWLRYKWLLRKTHKRIHTLSGGDPAKLWRDRASHDTKTHKHIRKPIDSDSSKNPRELSAQDTSDIALRGLLAATDKNRSREPSKSQFSV